MPRITTYSLCQAFIILLFKYCHFRGKATDIWKWCFKKYCSCEKECQFTALLGIFWLGHRLGEERCIIVHASLQAPKVLFSVLLACTEHNYSSTRFGVKKEGVTLFFLWHFLKFSKQVTRHVDFFVFKVITNYDHTSDP